MSTKQIKGVVVPRHDTAINWAQAKSFVPRDGELIVYSADSNGITYNETVTINDVVYPVQSSTTTRYKFGNGVDNVNVLPFATVDIAIADSVHLLKYTITNGSVTITGCNSSLPSTYAVPSHINGYPVTAIGASAFSNQNIVDITIPEGVTTIGSSAFSSCYDLTTVRLPKSLTSIYTNAFGTCVAIGAVYYNGSSSDWSGISIDSGNNYLTRATRYCDRGTTLPATESDYPGCYYRTVDGAVEWINPPMLDGVEYRTTERYLGKPVFTKTFAIDIPASDHVPVVVSTSEITLVEYSAVSSKDCVLAIVDTMGESWGVKFWFKDLKGSETNVVTKIKYVYND